MEVVAGDILEDSDYLDTTAVVIQYTKELLDKIVAEIFNCLRFSVAGLITFVRPKKAKKKKKSDLSLPNYCMAFNV